ncbi:MAG TPA: hypothetical protein VN857_14025 [Chthoniobacterales bacterium]|nr:hypothetical protein [Chthoniobacterales bacterium]
MLPVASMADLVSIGVTNGGTNIVRSLARNPLIVSPIAGVLVAGTQSPSRRARKRC